MSTSPDSWMGEAVLRGSTAADVPVVRFDADLSAGVSAVPSRLVEQARALARTTGYAEGWAQGQRAARVAALAAMEQVAVTQQAEAAERDAVVRRAAGAFIAAADGLSARVAPTMAEIESVLLHAAVELAEALLGHELTAGTGRDLNALRRAVSAAPGTGTLTVRLNPEDHRTLVDVMGAEVEFEGRSICLRSDPGLRPGDAIAENGAMTVDATLTNALARVRAVLAE
jgi:flagellar assembly protein FliH